MHGRVALVTDSTSCIPAELAAQWGIGVVPIQIQIGHWVDTENRVPRPAIIDALRSNEAVSTAPPDPAAFFWMYQEAAARGADEVVSVHISSGQSETYQRAMEAAAKSRVPVHVIDSRTTGMSLGYAVLAAARVAGAGGGPRRVFDALARRLDGSRELIYVDTLEYLRRGGRIGAARAWLGSTLKIKPILTLEQEITPVERVRTRRRAFERLLDHARELHSGGADAWVVQHVQDPDTAARLIEECRRDVFGSDPVFVSEIGPVIGAHVGPGLIGVGGVPPSVLD
jgi:DegV family protein with EDD domain